MIVYYLTCDELVTMPADARLRIKRRRAERERLQVQRPPDVIDGTWTSATPASKPRDRSPRPTRLNHRQLSSSANGDCGSASLSTSTGVLRSDQGFDVVEHIPDVDVHPGQHPVVAVEPKRDEFTAGNVAAEHHPLEAGRVPDVFHSEVVLVGEEIGQLSVFAWLAEHPGRRHRRLLERIGPVLGADPAAKQGMFGGGDVADRVDVRIAGAQ